MKIATFNVNGVNGRLPVLLRWLAEFKPDVACLQELKAPQENFPEAAIRQANYVRSGTAKRAGMVSLFSLVVWIQPRVVETCPAIQTTYKAATSRR